MTTRGRALLGAGIALLASTLAACTGGSAPVPTDAAPAPTAASEAPSVTPTTEADPGAASPPPRPSEMSEGTADGAAAAASYFMALYPYALATGDLSEWNAMSADTCDFCAGVRQDVEDRSSRGERNVGAVRVLASQGTEVDPGRWYSARLHVIIDESRDIGADDTVLEVHPQEEHQIDVVLTWSGDAWVIDEIGPAATPTT